MDTCPDFTPFVSDIQNKHERKDALRILKHTWGQLDKETQKNLYSLFNITSLMHKKGEAAQEDLDECKEDLKAHPELAHFFNQFYSKVITPVTYKDQFKNDRIKAATGLEKGVKELQSKHVVKNFNIGRVA
jgi:hypothetical protein